MGRREGEGVPQPQKAATQASSLLNVEKNNSQLIVAAELLSSHEVTH